jgi:hypothetical protein
MEASMHVILGASGNTGHVVAKTLLGRGQKVRAVGRNATHLQPLAANGAEIFIADVTDASGPHQSLPPGRFRLRHASAQPLQQRLRAFQDRTSDAIAAAIQNAGVKNIVSLSSFGADKSFRNRSRSRPSQSRAKAQPDRSRQRSSPARRILHGKHSGASRRYSHDGLGHRTRSSGSQTSHDRHSRHRSRRRRRSLANSPSAANKPRSCTASAILTTPKSPPSSAPPSASPTSPTSRRRTINSELPWFRWGCPTISLASSSRWRARSIPDTCALSNLAPRATPLQRPSKLSSLSHSSPPTSNKQQPNHKRKATLISERGLFHVPCPLLTFRGASQRYRSYPTPPASYSQSPYAPGSPPRPHRLHQN